MKKLWCVSLAVAAILGSASFAAAQNGRDRLPNGTYANEYNRAMMLPLRSTHSTNPAHDVYTHSGTYLGSDPDVAVRREIQRARVNGD
jgi:hypothetical protein